MSTEGCFVIGLMASVVKDATRLKYLGQLLDSIRNQSVALDGFAVSIYIDPALGVNVSKLFANLPDCRILKQSRPLPQFVQYRHLNQKLDSYFPTDRPRVLLFSDDDDIWHRHRVYGYRTLWNKGLREVPTMDKVSSAVYRIDVEHVDPNCKKHMGTNLVDEMLDCGCLKMFPTRGMVEYHNYMIRRRIFNEFFETCPARIIEHNRYADMEFRKFIHCYKPGEYETLQLQTPPDVRWLYFYRGPHAGYNAVTAVHQLEDVLNPAKVDDCISRWFEMMEIDYMRDRASEMLTKFEQFMSGSPVTQILFNSSVAKVKAQRARIKLEYD